MYRTADTLRDGSKKGHHWTKSRYPRTPSHRVGAFCGQGPGHPRENDTYDVQRSDAAAVTGTRSHSGDTRKLTVCTGTQNDQMAGTSWEVSNFARWSVASNWP